MVEMTMKEFIDITYNPRRYQERMRLFNQWDSVPFAETLFAKADYTTGDTGYNPNLYQVLYGAPFFNWLNYESNIWSLLPKKPTGDRTGFRVLITGRTTSSGLQETANPMATSQATFQAMYYTMKWMNVTFGATEKELWQAERNDALDVWSANRDHWGKRHVQSLDEFLGRVHAVATQATYAIESIDRMISNSTEATCAATLTDTGYPRTGLALSGATSCDVWPYAGRYRRSGYAATGYPIYPGNPFDAVVDQNNTNGATSRTLRAFDLTLLDGCIRQVRLNGGPQVDQNLIILTGPDTADVISQKLEARQRFKELTRVAKTLNGVQRVSETGVEAGFDVLSYKGIPIFVSKAIYNQRPSGGLSNVYGIHLPDVFISTGMPTLYLETSRQEWLLLDKLRRKAGYFTAAELVFTRFNTHFKITDLSA